MSNSAFENQTSTQSVNPELNKKKICEKKAAFVKTEHESVEAAEYSYRHIGAERIKRDERRRRRRRNKKKVYFKHV